MSSSTCHALGFDAIDKNRTFRPCVNLTVKYLTKIHSLQFYQEIIKASFCLHVSKLFNNSPFVAKAFFHNISCVINL